MKKTAWNSLFMFLAGAVTAWLLAGAVAAWFLIPHEWPYSYYTVPDGIPFQIDGSEFEFLADPEEARKGLIIIDGSWKGLNIPEPDMHLKLRIKQVRRMKATGWEWIRNYSDADPDGVQIDNSPLYTSYWTVYEAVIVDNYEFDSFRKGDTFFFGSLLMRYDAWSECYQKDTVYDIHLNELELYEEPFFSVEKTTNAMRKMYQYQCYQWMPIRLTPNTASVR